MPAVRRIVQKTGSSTLTVSLPRAWAKKYDVGKGSDVFAVEQSDGSLVLLTAPEKQKRESFDLNADDVSSKEELKRRFYAAYIAGFSSIRVHSANRLSPELRKTVTQAAKRLIGVEVTEESPNFMIINDFFSQEGLNIEKTTKRMHLITRSLFEDLMEGRDLEALVERDDEVDRLRFLLLRQLNLALKNPGLLRSLNLTETRCIDFATVTLCIERVADRITSIAKMLSQTKSAENVKPLKPYLKSAFELYNDSTTAFFDRDIILAISVISKRLPFQAEVDELRKRLWQKNTGNVLLVDHIADIAEYSVEIAEQAINQS